MLFMLLVSGCSSKHKDYSYLISRAGKDRNQVIKLLDFYKREDKEDKLKMTEFFLDQLPFQYQLRYIISNGGGMKLLNEGLSNDSIEVLKHTPGVTLKIDTDWDISSFKSAFIIHQINRADSLRGKYIWFRKIPISQYCNFILPYRLNNEELSDYKDFYGKRYLSCINDILMDKIDTLNMLRVYMDAFFSNTFYPKVKEINFDSSLSLKSMGDGCESCVDREDEAVLNVHALRAIGVPSTYEYLPVVKGSPGQVIRIDIKGRDQKTYFSSGNKTPYKFKIAKCYRNNFSMENNSNPYRELISMGISDKDIPFSLNIPKVQDVTEERTIAKDLQITVSDSLLKQKVLYLSTQCDNKWKIIAYGIIDIVDKKVRFKNIGSEMVYHLATNNNGQIKLVDAPFILDSLGNIIRLSSQKSQIGTLRIINSDQTTKISLGESYKVCFWDCVQHRWDYSAKQVAKSETLQIHDIPINTLYKVVHNDNLESVNYLFTYEKGKQIWW